MKVLVVVDAQNDFFTGALKNDAAVKIIPNLVNKVKDALYKTDDTIVVFTKDTHKIPEYFETEEGRSLQIAHCVEGTDGAEIIPELLPFIHGSKGGRVEVIGKSTYMCQGLFDFLRYKSITEKIESVEFVGVCTEICVISNALAARGFMPKTHIAVDSSCCAGLTEEGHLAALRVMRACNVYVKFCLVADEDAVDEDATDEEVTDYEDCYYKAFSGCTKDDAIRELIEFIVRGL